MDLHEIKQRALNLKDNEFNRFQNWFETYGWQRKNKHAKSSKLRQAVLNLSDKDLERFDYWFEDLSDERWAEEVRNDPIAQQGLEIMNFIMKQPDPVPLLAKLLGIKSEDNQKAEKNETK